MHNYAINSVLFSTTVREKYMRMYERFIEELKLYSKAIRVLSKGYYTHFSVASIKTSENPERGKNSNHQI